MPPRSLHVAIVGATGAVGQEMLSILAERKFPVGKLTAFASPATAATGKSVSFRGAAVRLEPLAPGCFRGVDVALFSAGGAISREWCPRAVAEGALTVDNSSTFRQDPKVPLVIPEVNPEALRGKSRLFAVPNCSTIVMLMALKPLHDAAGLTRVHVSTYQAVSGAGAKALRQLEAETLLWAQARMAAEPARNAAGVARGANAFAGAVAARRALSTGQPAHTNGHNGKAHASALPMALPHTIAFNVIPHVGGFLPDGFSEEEAKFVFESRRILGLPKLAVAATTVRVPVWRSHSEAIYAEFARPLSPDKARRVLARAPGVKLYDEPSSGRYPMPMLAAGGDDTWVGRIRKDPTVKNGLCLFVSGDQLRKGAALTAIQIAEAVLAQNERTPRPVRKT